MTFQQLKYILEISKYGSMSVAAKTLYVSQPALSSAVKELEKELNIEIFERTKKGIRLSVDGREFLLYAKQIVEQADLLEDRFIKKKKNLKKFAISTQHYAFIVEAFSRLVSEIKIEEYDLFLRETKTKDIIDDVNKLNSELGFIYISKENRKIMLKVLKDNELEFHPIFDVLPHIFVSSKNPLASRKCVKLKDLKEYPCLSFEQGTQSSLFFKEELLHNFNHNKNIIVTDRATLFNLLIGVNGYTISTGFINSDLNGGEGIVSIPLESRESVEVGYIKHKRSRLSELGEKYLKILEQIINEEYKD